jgi:plasmid stabilization system protein ParE
MPRKAWSPKRERQYEHIKEGYEERGVSEDEAEERAARTVNKQRSEHGETKAQRRRKGR